MHVNILCIMMDDYCLQVGDANNSHSNERMLFHGKCVCVCVWVWVCVRVCVRVCEHLTICVFSESQVLRLSITLFIMDLTSDTPTSVACLVLGYILPSTHPRATSMCGGLVGGLVAVNTGTDRATRARGEIGFQVGEGSPLCYKGALFSLSPFCFSYLIIK